jgi:hypothetical protein
LSVWAVQVVFALFLLNLVAGIAPGIGGFLQAGRPIVIVLVSLAAGAFVFYALVAVAGNSPSSRWKGLMGLALIFLIVPVSKIFELADPAQFGSSNDAQADGAFIGFVAEIVALSLLFWRFGFSRRVRQYFGEATAAPAKPPSQR